MRLPGEPVGVREPPAPPAAPPKEGLSRGLVLSVVLHLAVGGLVVFGVPDLFRPAPPQDQPVAVDLVTIAPETRATHPNPNVPRPRAKPDIPLADAAVPKPRPKPQPPLPAPLPSSAVMPPHPAAKPIEKAEWEPPRPQPAPAPVVVPRPQEKPHPPREAAEPRRPRRERAYDPGDFERLLKNLAPEHNAPSPDLPPQLKRLAAAAPSSQPQAPLGKRLTASEIDLIRQQIERCWNIPEGARDAKDLVVEIKVFVDPDGDVRQAVVLDAAREAGDPIFRVAAESARRALFNPACRPLRLPPDKYESWKEFVVNFNPRDLL